MTTSLIVTALLIIPAAILILIGDQFDPLEEARRISRKNARASNDKTQLRSRLEELGLGTEQEYEDLLEKKRIKDEEILQKKIESGEMIEPLLQSVIIA